MAVERNMKSEPPYIPVADAVIETTLDNQHLQVRVVSHCPSCQDKLDIPLGFVAGEPTIHGVLMRLFQCNQSHMFAIAMQLTR